MDRALLRVLILAIEDGEADDDLEQILTAAHNRKNQIRTGRSRRK